MKLNVFIGLFSSYDKVVIQDITGGTIYRELHDGYIKDINMSEYDMEEYFVVQSRVFDNGLMILVKENNIIYREQI